MSAASLEVLAPLCEKRVVTKTCLAWAMTHDFAAGIVFWQAADFEHHYYIMQDGDETKKTFSACAKATVGGYTQYSCKGWPHAVVAPQCSGAYYGPKGPCCKMDDAILFAVRAPWWHEIEWFIFSDDDVRADTAAPARAFRERERERERKRESRARAPCERTAREKRANLPF